MPLTKEQQEEIDKALEKEREAEIEDINDLDVIDLVDVVEDPPKPDPVKPVVEDPSVKEELPKDPPVVEDPPKPEVKEDPPVVDDLEELRKIINKQNADILALKSGMPVQPKETKKEDPPKPEDPPKKSAEVEKPQEYQSVDYIGNLDMDDVTADKNILNQIINNAVQDAIKHVVGMIPDINGLTANIPKTVQEQVQQQISIDRIVNNFYDDNKDLTPVKETVAQVAQNIAIEHPDYDVNKLFNEAAKLTRSLLRMPEPVIEKEENSEFNRPAFTKTKTSKRQTPAQTNSLQDEIAEL